MERDNPPDITVNVMMSIRHDGVERVQAAAPEMFTRLTAAAAVTNPTRSHHGLHKGDRQAEIKIDGPP